MLKHHADVALVGGHPGDVLAGNEDLPDVTATKPAIMFSVVVFPDPLGPRKVMNSPGAMSRLTSRTAGVVVFGYCLTRLRRATATPRLGERGASGACVARSGAAVWSEGVA